MPKHQLIGIIISDKMVKTVVVKVERIKEHPKYRRRFKTHKKYKVHDEKEEYKVGDEVVIEETRPLSKDKRWKVIKKILKHQGVQVSSEKEKKLEDQDVKSEHDPTRNNIKNSR